MVKDKLSVQQATFVRHICDGKNQADSYRLAGYKCTTVNSLDSKAARLVTNGKIALAIATRRAKLAEKSDVKSEEIIDELKGMALANVTDVIEWDETGETTIIASDQLQPYVKSAIKKVKSKTKSYYKDNELDYVESEIEVEMHGKEGPLRQLGEYLGLWKADKGNTLVINQFLTSVQNKYGIVEAK